MARNNGNGGSGAIVAVVLVALLAVLYQCNAGRYGLPVLKVAGASSSTTTAPPPAAGKPSPAPVPDSAAPGEPASSAAAPSASAEASPLPAPAPTPTGLSYPSCVAVAGPNGFSYCAPADLIPDTGPRAAHKAGTKVVMDSPTVFLAGPAYNAAADWSIDGLGAGDVCFPLADAAYANSQFFNPGGHGYVTPEAAALPPAQRAALEASKTFADYNRLHGLENDAHNFQAPWRDTFCENRGYYQKNDVCQGVSGGHQGQDIRPQTDARDTYWAVAAEDGVIYVTADDAAWDTKHGVPRYWLKVKSSGEPARYYSYLHMLQPAKADQLYNADPVKYARMNGYPHWKAGDVVHKGQRLGLVSNYFGETTTSIHLHFEIRLILAQKVNGVVLGSAAPIPPYMTLVKAYERKLSGAGCG